VVSTTPITSFEDSFLVKWFNSNTPLKSWGKQGKRMGDIFCGGFVLADKCRNGI